MNSKIASAEQKFSRVYVERAALEYPLAQEFLARFPEAERIEVDNYKSVFNRPKQNWELQKQSLAAILALKADDFLYPGSHVAPDFGYEHFYYNAQVLNCLYDCEYCYLQGMFNSGRSVFFVNIEDYFEATREKLKTAKPLYLCLSYDTDLLAYEGLMPYTRRWCEFVAENEELTVEIRTKSAHSKLFSEIPANERIVLAWTFSPEELRKAFEHGTATLAGRIKAAKAAQKAGWKVRICIDPVIATENWQELYKELVEQLAGELDAERVRDLTLGSFRMGKDYFKRTKKNRPKSKILTSRFHQEGSAVGYPAELEAELLSTVEGFISEAFPDKRLEISRTFSA